MAEEIGAAAATIVPSLPTRLRQRWADWYRRATWVDLFLAVVRIVILVAVCAGVLNTLVSQRYSATEWFSFIAFGLTIGGIYALIALGYTMVYGILRMINFAHGDVMAAGTFAGYFAATVIDRHGLIDSAPLAALVGTMIAAAACSALLSLFVERIAYRPFLHVRSLAPLICAIGVSFVIEYSLRGFFGTGNRAYPDWRPFEGSIDIAGVGVPKLQLLSITAAIVLMLALHVVVNHTRLGKAMRAVSEDRDAAALCGIDVGKVITLTFVLGGALAGVAGVLYALVFKQIAAFTGFFLGIKGFGAAVLGGIGNVPGAMIGGFVLGLVESTGPALFLDGLGIAAPFQLRDVVAFSMLVMVLVFRPQGLLGERLAAKRA
ncbi:MAG TPA: branched-chain amino acid ABC transporter permease [Dongiaceae bacterium]|nr:branched-chain amino acid ABC transporter permease [Dongiaceae bacterium]